MTRLLAPILVLLLAGCHAPAPVMTDEPGVRPYGHVVFCREPANKDHVLCRAKD